MRRESTLNTSSSKTEVPNDIRNLKKDKFKRDWSHISTHAIFKVGQDHVLEFLVDNIFVVFAGKFSKHIIGIPMGTNCAPLLADICLYS